MMANRHAMIYAGGDMGFMQGLGMMMNLGGMDDAFEGI